ncbi:solute carrier family 23 protein [Candidimonas nitroreducens]|uniref:solute carrier family 23 protein n=1 Tax=Candidimonas nitroreducens TaxID=683354 RepID=UPI001303DE91|nr:solute carrier family 23 protein [Candidimonas nitroreducens]
MHASTMALFSKIKLPPVPAFRRPADLVYALGEKPPAFTLFGLAVQHMVTALTCVVYVLAAAKIGGLSAASTQGLVTATTLGMALATFFQAWGGRLGSGLMLVDIPSPLLIVIGGSIIGQFGIAGAAAMSLTKGLVSLAASVVVPRLRAILPPTVAGVVVCIGGLSLVAPALTHMTGLQSGAMDGADILIGTVTLLVIVALSIWGNRRLKLAALLAGLLAGVILAAVLGKLHGMALLSKSSVLALPQLHLPNLAVDPAALAAVALVSLMAQLDSLGSLVLMHKMNDADWRRPSMRLVSHGIRANGLGNLLASCLGSYPTGMSSANLALCHISRSTSRWIGLVTALLLAVSAFLPQVALGLTLIPTSVVGAIEVYAAAYLVVSGIELIASRALDSRGIFMIGLSFVAGLGVMVLPQLADQAPAALHFVARSGIITGGVMAIVLNAIFRLGTSQRAVLHIDEASHSERMRRIVEFVESSGARWSARRDVVRRAAQAMLEGAEALEAAGEGRRLVQVQGSFDEFNLDFELLYQGPALLLEPSAEPSPAALLDMREEDFHNVLGRALSGVSHMLLKRLADRVTSGTRGRLSYLRLHLNH